MNDLERRTKRIWRDMVRRCTDQRNGEYHNYGGRGIRIIWGSYEEFIADMGICPAGYSIERVEVDGNYCKENCKWIPKNLQGKNTRKCVFVEIDGIPLTTRDAAFRLGVGKSSLSSWINKGRKGPLPSARKTLMVPFDGEVITLRKACQKLGIDYCGAWKKMKRGDPIEKVLTIRKNPIVEFNGVKMGIAEASRLSGINFTTLCGRVRNGCPSSRLFDPVQVHRKVK